MLSLGLSPPIDTNFTADKQPTKTWNIKRKRTIDYVRLTSQPLEFSLVAKILHKPQRFCHKFGVKSWIRSPILADYLSAVFSLQGAPSTERTGLNYCPVLPGETSKNLWEGSATTTLSELFVVFPFQSILVYFFS